MKSEDIKNRRWSETDRQTLRRISKEQAEGTDVKIDTSDIPALTKKQLAQMVRLREVERKVAVSVRLDPRVVEWLKSKGNGHLTRINDILANLMELEERTGGGLTTGRKRV